MKKKVLQVVTQFTLINQNTVAAHCNEFGRNELLGYNELGLRSQLFFYNFILNEPLK